MTSTVPAAAMARLLIIARGATGALGRQLVPRLVARGHEVVGMTRSPSKSDVVRALGATPAVADALDPEAVARTVAEAQPEAIVHQLTALDIADGHVQGISSIVNPDKLRHVGPVGEIRALLSEGRGR